MENSIEILAVYKDSFRANLYTKEPFRMIGLIDVIIKYTYGTERVTLAFYRSSGTNSGKIKGLWYPIVGIKLYPGSFSEFTNPLNYILTNTTRNGSAKKGWLAKSPFFYKISDTSKIRGFSNGKHYQRLLKIGKTLRSLYHKKRYHKMDKLNAEYLNQLLMSEEIYHNNKYTQRKNYECFLKDIYYNK